MKVLVTGNLGYVGPVVARHLRDMHPGITLVGFDAGFFALSAAGAAPYPNDTIDLQHFGDVRDLPQALLESVDAVVHLAAISNDPMGNTFERITGEINHRATLALAEKAAQAGVSHFVFASSCSVYGCAPGAPRREGDDLDPQTAYARSKVASEQALADLASDMTITSLRFATACGLSDNLRLDLVLNDFVATALTRGEILVLSDGTPWRPLIDVRDMARAIAWGIARDPREGGRVLAVNAGSSERNYQVRDLAHAVARELPGTTVSINDAAPPDRRSYKVDFSLFKALAPAHQPQITLQHSILMLKEHLAGAQPIVRDACHPPYIRLKVLEHLLATGRLTPELRWARAAAGADMSAMESVGS